jgi:hypothetical protein
MYADFTLLMVDLISSVCGFVLAPSQLTLEHVAGRKLIKKEWRKPWGAGGWRLEAGAETNGERQRAGPWQAGGWRRE